MGFSGSYKLLLFILEEWKLITLLTTIFLLYFYYTSTFDHFAKKGVKFMKPTIFLGNLGPRLTSKTSFHEFQLEIYNYFKGHPYGGTFEGRRPLLHIFDTDLIKAITVRDFEYFVDRNALSSNEPRYLSRSLLNLKGSEWKGVRSTLTPSFSSSRLKNMLPLMELCAQQMVEYLSAFDDKDVEMKDTMGHFTLEIIGACAFGIKCDALTNENAHFVEVAKKFGDMPKAKRFLIFFILMFMPKMFKYLNISFMNPETSEELVKILKAAKAERRLSNKKQNDFLQLMLNAAEKEKLESEEKSSIHLDDDTIDAQSLLFLIAGYETSSTLLSFAIHMLALKPDIQSRLREHVENVTNGKELSYELLAELTFLEGFLLETLRIYPPVSRVDRVCTKPYSLPNTNINLKVGEVVAIPVYGIHMDPDIYPNPQEFIPERFVGDEKKNRPSHLFLAFGSGPRNCIGMRFAMFSAKIAMVTLLKNFEFTVCSKTEDPIKFHKRGILLKAEGGCWVRINKL